MKNKINFRKKIGGFTLIEIITTIVILSVISILGFTYANNYKLTQFNVRRTADIGTLENASKSYFEVNKTYPMPAGNKKYYDTDGVYAHASTGAYGISGYATNEIFGKQFLATVPMDPQTKNFYAYAKNQDQSQSYQFATILDKQGTFYAYVKGNYPAEVLGGLIKEHNGPNFVLGNSSKHLPYDPYEVKLSGIISSYSGTVTINGNPDTTKTIMESDVVKVLAGGSADLILSDGSDIKLGSTTKDSILEMKNLQYKEDDNLLTKVTLKLSLGEIWVKAPQLEEGSELSIETDNAAATVRGTVFGMTNDGTGSGSIGVIKGTVQVQSIINDRREDNISNSDIFTSGSGALIKDVEGDYLIEVKDGEGPVTLNYQHIGGAAINLPATGATGSISTEKVNDIIYPKLKINNASMPEIKRLYRSSTGSIDMIIANKGGNILEVYGDNMIQSPVINSLSGEVRFASTSYSNAEYLGIRICHVPADYCSPTGNTIIEKPDGTLDSEALPSRDDNPPACSSGHPPAQRQPVCSRWKRIELPRGELSFDKTVTTSRTSGEIACNGEVAIVPGVGSVCFGSGLVAFAPYDNVGDLGFFMKDGTPLPFLTNNISAGYDVLRYKKGLGTTDFASENTDSQSMLLTTSGLPFDAFGNDVIKRLSIAGSYIETQSGEKGIFTTSNSQDFLNYKLEPLSLGNKFEIEMSVRGAALKRTSNKYLFTVGNVYLDIYSGYLFLGYTGASVNNVKKINSIGLTSLNDNQMYNVNAKFDGTIWDLNIMDTDGSRILSGVPAGYTGITVDSNNLLSIGAFKSGENYGKQWNDIINSVKIYKK